MPTTDSLTVFWGELLSNPIPLELSFGSCGYNCAYCFASLNKAHRNADSGQALRLIRDRNSRTTIEAYLLAQGYPVCVSNRSDPFAPRNAVHSLPVLQVMAETGIPVFLQTKGGAAAYQALDFLPPSAWYVTVSFTDDALRQRIEPHAPSLDERWALIDAIVAAGSSVLIGVNPMVSEWLPNPEALFRKAVEHGVECVVLADLHLNSKQTTAMTEWKREALGPEIIAASLKRKWVEAENLYVHEVGEVAADCGLLVDLPYRFKPSRYPEVYRKHYAKTFPIMQDFVNAVAESADDIFSFADFWGVVGPHFPAGQFRIQHYIGTSAKQLTATTKMPPRMTYGDLMQIIWGHPEIFKFHPAWSFGFALATKAGSDNEVGLVDENGLPWVVYDRAGRFREGAAEYVE